MRIEDLYELDFNRMTRDQLLKVGSFVRNQANRGFTLWERKEYRSPAFYGMEKSGGRIGDLSNLDRNTIYKEINRGLNFLSDRTRTVKGWSKVKTENIGTLKEHTGVKIRKKDYDRFYDAFEKAKEINPALAYFEFKYSVMGEAATYVKDFSKSPDELAIEISNAFDKKYGINAEAKQDFMGGGVSRAFGFDIE